MSGRKAPRHSKKAKEERREKRGRGNGKANGNGNGNGNGTEPKPERPTQAAWSRGGHRGANRNNDATAQGKNTAKITPHNGANVGASAQGRGKVSANIMALDTAGGPNSTPFAAKEFQKRFQHLKLIRPQLRQRFINEGLMNPDGQMRLEDAVNLYGLCTDMCPEYERVRRIVEFDVKPPECTSETEHGPRRERIPDETRMVKAYTRSAAGMDVELVSDIRTPATCLKTFDYLMQRLDKDEFDFLHSWIWDRVRAIRKDLSTQSIRKRTDIALELTFLERSARYYMLSAHQMARSNKQDYSHQQDIEQFNQTLMSLKQRYEDNRRAGLPCENEIEFFTYRLLLAPLYPTAQMEMELYRAPASTRNNPRVLVALELFRLVKSFIFVDPNNFVQCQTNWRRYWRLIKSPSVSYLMACAAEITFQWLRHAILDALWRCYRLGKPSKPHTIDSWTLDCLPEVLGFDTELEAEEFCTAFGFRFGTTAEGKKFLDVTGAGFHRGPLPRAHGIKPQTFSHDIVEWKRCNRAFSAVVQNLPVQEAMNRGLMIGAPSLPKDLGDHKSLFIPETSTKKMSSLAKPGPTISSAASNPFLPTPATTSTISNPFLPKPATASNSPTNAFLTQNAAAPVVGQAANPFLRGPATVPASGQVTNPFLATSAPAFSNFNGTDVQPGVFDASKNDIKFGSPGSSTTSFGTPGKPNPFLPKPTSTPSNPNLTVGAEAFSPDSSKFDSAPTQQPGTTASASAPTGFALPGFLGGQSQRQDWKPGSSFTPAGSPASSASSSQDVEKRKADEDEKRLIAEADARAQQQRARDELERQARENAKRQRAEAEERQRAQQQERERLVREARERQAQKEQAKKARLQARDSAYMSAAEQLLLESEKSLLEQFLEEIATRTARQVKFDEDVEKRRQAWKEKKAWANAMYQQRQLGFKRMVMAAWLLKIEQKKRAQQTRERRKRARERREERARMANEELALSMPTPVELEASAAQIDDEAAFRKPQAPASARRAKRTKERHGKEDPPQPEPSSLPPSAPVTASEPSQTSLQAILTPVSMNNSQISSRGYSEAYQKSTAPIDRTETDWFELRALGLDPNKYRKRSFGSASGDNTPGIETKRPRISPYVDDGNSQPPRTQNEDFAARLSAVQQATKNTGVSPASSVICSSPRDSRTSTLLEKVRQNLSKSQTSQTSPPNVQHEWGRSVPFLGGNPLAARKSVLDRNKGSATSKDAPAYRNRPSRFVPQHLYGKGAEAVRAYRIEQGLYSPTATRASTTEPRAASSPIPTQRSYLPPNRYTHEQYSGREDSNDVEVIDVDAEQEDVDTTEEEYEGDGDDEEEQHQPQQSHLSRRQSGHSQDYDEEGDSGMSDSEELEEELEEADGHEYGQYGHSADQALDDYEVYTEEDGGEYDEEDYTQQQHQHFAQPVQRFQSAQPTKLAGNTEDDAIELSD